MTLLFLLQSFVLNGNRKQLNANIHLLSQVVETLICLINLTSINIQSANLFTSQILYIIKSKLYNIYEKENIGGKTVGSPWVTVTIDIDANGIVTVTVNDLESVSLGSCKYLVEKLRLTT